VVIGLIWIVGLSTAAGLLVLVAQRLSPRERPEAHMEATGFVFAIAGVLYAIVVAFILIAVWDTMTTARTNSYQESSALVDVYSYAHTLPSHEGARIEQLATQYTNTVINREWPVMRKHGTVGLTGWGDLDQLRVAVSATQPAQDADDSAYQRVTDTLDVLYQDRQDRLAAANTGVSSVVWLVLLGGGLLTIAFTYLFNVAGTTTQAILVVGLTAMVVLLLYAVFELEYPYSRGMSVGPQAFQFALTRFVQISAGG
jgi:hypothetical protein